MHIDGISDQYATAKIGDVAGIEEAASASSTFNGYTDYRSPDFDAT